MRPSSPARYATTWISVFAAERTACFRKSSSDSTGAAEQIPKDARGRFITGDGIVFQGYLFDENTMFKDEGKGIL